jgi:hypothetical protein
VGPGSRRGRRARAPAPRPRAGGLRDSRRRAAARARPRGQPAPAPGDLGERVGERRLVLGQRQPAGGAERHIERRPGLPGHPRQQQRRVRQRHANARVPGGALAATPQQPVQRLVDDRVLARWIPRVGVRGRGVGEREDRAPVGAGRGHHRRGHRHLPAVRPRQRERAVERERILRPLREQAARNEKEREHHGKGSGAAVYGNRFGRPYSTARARATRPSSDAQPVECHSAERRSRKSLGPVVAIHGIGARTW